LNGLLDARVAQLVVPLKIALSVGAVGAQGALEGPVALLRIVVHHHVALEVEGAIRFVLAAHDLALNLGRAIQGLNLRQPILGARMLGGYVAL